MTSRFIRAATAATILLTLIHLGLQRTIEPGALIQVIGSSLVVAALLAWAATHTASTGVRRLAGLFALSWGLGSFNNLIEAVFFGVVTRTEAVAMVVVSVVSQALAVLLVAWLAGAPTMAGQHSPSRPARWWAARIGAAVLGYLMLYFVAGMLVYPYVRDFYARIGLPTGVAVALMQVALRGPVFTALGILAIRMVPGDRAQQIWWSMLAIAGWSGVAPLLMPNPFFPDAVRWAHFVEVASSNLVFGAWVGWLFGTSGRTSPAASGTTAGATATDSSSPA